MNFLDALVKVKEGNRVTCPNWSAQTNKPCYLFVGSENKLMYWCGIVNEAQEVNLNDLVCWLLLDKGGQHDYEVLVEGVK